MKLVLVTWNDAQDHSEQWVPEADATVFSESTCTIKSTGFLVKSTDKYMTLAGDWDAEDKNWGRLTKIPAGMVKEIKDLGETE